jgi:hypothetical protein
MYKLNAVGRQEVLNAIERKGSYKAKANLYNSAENWFAQAENAANNGTFSFHIGSSYSSSGKDEEVKCSPSWFMKTLEN